MRYLRALALMWLATATAAAQTAGRAALQGTWKLNVDRSDRPNAPAGPEGSRGLPETEADPTAVMVLMQPAATLTISADGGAITIAPERAARQTVVPDRPPVTDTLLDGRVLTTRARWKNDRLVVERRFAGLARVKETYRLERETGELIVDAEVSPERFPRTITLRRVYDRQPAKPGPSAEQLEPFGRNGTTHGPVEP